MNNIRDEKNHSWPWNVRMLYNYQYLVSYAKSINKHVMINILTNIGFNVRNRNTFFTY